MNQKGVVGLLIVVILLVAGIGVAVYLSQKPQIFKPKAAETVNPTSGLYGSTPFSEIPNYPKPANGIQTMVYFIFANPTLTADKPWLNYLGSAIDYVWFDQSSLATCDTAATLCTFGNFTAVTNKLRELNPNIKTGVHAGAAGGAAPYHMIHPYLSDADFLHKPDGTRQPMTAGSIVTGINLSSPTTRQKIADGWKQIFQTNPALTGINLDSYIAYSGYYPGGCREGACNTEAFWIPALFDLSSRTMATNPGKDITYNGISYPGGTSYGGDMNILPVAYHNGVLSEWPHEMLVSPAIFRKYLDGITAVTNQGKKVFFWVQPEVFHYSHGNNFLETNNITRDINLERFYLASYLLFQKNPLTYFGYSPLTTLYDGNNGLYWYKDWNMDYGIPTGNWINPATDLYTRPYANGWVIVNPSTTVKQFAFPAGEIYREWEPETGPELSGTISIPARSGKFFFKKKPLSARYELISPPSGWSQGNPPQFQVKVTNTGTETWLKKDANTPTGRTDLAAYIGHDDDWTHAQTASLTVLSADVAPGQSQIITASITTPGGIADAYTLRLRMVKQGFAWFEPVFKIEVPFGHAFPSPSLSPSPSASAIPSLPPLSCTTKPNLLKPSNMTSEGLVFDLSGGTNSEVTSNQIYKIDFSQFSNGTVTIGNTVFTQPGSYSPPQPTNNVRVLIKQVAYGAATNISLSVTDRCGPFSTLLGGGIGSNWPNPNPSPSPSQSPSGGCDRDNQCPAGQACTQVQCIQAPCNRVCLPVSSPSPAASVKPGDTDNDGDVDIFDFNTVVSDFGKTNDPVTKADLDNDNDVDIFDYNIVVGNFGK